MRKEQKKITNYLGSELFKEGKGNEKRDIYPDKITNIDIKCLNNGKEMDNAKQFIKTFKKVHSVKRMYYE